MAGPWEKYGNQPGSVFTLPQSPKEASDDAESRRRWEEEQRLRQAAADRAAAEQNKPPAGYRWNQQGGLEPIPGGPSDPQTLQAATRPVLTAKERADAITGYNSASQLDRIVAQLEEQYKAGPGATSGIAGARDYLPLGVNQQFDSTANAARGIVGTALGFTGGQLNTATEAEQAIGPYLPRAGDKDTVIRDKIERLRSLANDARTRSVSILGGVPDANGRITPWQQTYMAGGDQGTGNVVGFGDNQKATPVSPEMQAELNGYIQKNAGNLDPAQLNGFINDLYRKYGYGPNPANEQWSQEAARVSRQGGTINSNIPPVQQKMSLGEVLGNSALNNPVSSAGVNFIDATGLGALNALSGGRVQDLSNSSTGNQIAAAMGQIGGAIAGTEGMGFIGRNTLGRAAPRLMGGGVGGEMARNLTTDAAYSAAYGGNQGQDPLTSAALGVTGSVAGNALARGAGRVMEGFPVSGAVQSLRDRGIPLTVGQTLGGIPKKIEDAMTSIPYIGDIVNARRSEGFDAFNQQAFKDAGSRIDYVPQQIGQAGVDELGGRVGDAYTRATAGVDIPLDPQLEAELAAIRAQAGGLPPDLGDKFNRVMENRVDPFAQAGNMTGDQYQQMNRSLAGYKAETSKAGFEADYRQALSDVQQALRNQMERGGGADVVQALADADATYRANKVLQDAVDKAASGQQSGNVGTFTPNQLQRADITSGKKYGRGGMAFKGLSNDAQAVLPSTIPDSGTARRVTQMALPAALGGTGAGIGALADGTEGGATGAGYGLALGALLAAAGTSKGQQLLTSALTGRPEAIADLGRIVRKKRGLFGAGAIPLALTLGN